MLNAHQPSDWKKYHPPAEVYSRHFTPAKWQALQIIAIYKGAASPRWRHDQVWTFLTMALQTGSYMHWWAALFFIQWESGIVIDVYLHHWTTCLMVCVQYNVGHFSVFYLFNRGFVKNCVCCFCWMSYSSIWGPASGSPLTVKGNFQISISSSHPQTLTTTRPGLWGRVPCQYGYKVLC